MRAMVDTPPPLLPLPIDKPGWVHAMISDAWQPNAVNLSLSCEESVLNISAGDVAATASEDGGHAITVRVVNTHATPLAVTLATSDGGGGIASSAGGVVSYNVLEGNDCAVDAFPYQSEHARPCANTPSQPGLFAPGPVRTAAAGAAVTVPPYSFVVLTTTA